MTKWKRIPGTDNFRRIECDDIPNSVYREISFGEHRKIKPIKEAILKDSKKII